ncbi:ABC transporter transmembrane domain-containing protein [Fluviispira multicolorata]|uniref:ATP-binding cassette domain-containing protein n=1 Tax=Fluviispira multicolorata TaxID=2654512 RepID=A0A833JDG7_9BACT|nr:ABC transporter ATP-binding protein [Fluviispira multicolorata]KAB8028461.1 ATP-binding cassette domain-containing protein [Fluviispira multicolorata]
MKHENKNSFFKIVWSAGKKDILLSIPWLPIYSFSEIILALSAGTILQLVFVTTPRIQISELIPGDFKNYIHFNEVIDRRELVFIIPIFIVVAALIKLISGFMSSYLTERAGHKVAHSLREEMLKGFLSSPGNTLDQKNPDSTANQLMQDTALLQGAISKGTISAARDFIVLIGIIASMLIISWKTFIIGLAIVVPLALLLRKISQKLNFYTREGQKKQIGISTRILSTHNGLLSVNALRSHDREERDFEVLNIKNYFFMKKSLFVRTFFSPSMEFFATAVLAVIFAWRLSFVDNFQSGTYSTMLILLAFSFRYIKNIAGTITFFSEIKVVLQRVKNFIGDYSHSSLYKRPIALSSQSKEAVIAKNVTYITEGGKAILENCSLKIPKGCKVAFIGESGAGKTTFLRSLAGLIIPNEGEISVTSDFLLASQSPYIFRGTVKENIIYAEQGIPEHISDDKAKELVLALMLAFSDSGSQLMLDKKLGFLGDGLSGGEKARVALARTLFASPKLILLDEPTANLDTNSANLFWQAIHKWKSKDSEHTVIAVSHSINEVKDFDMCYVFENGKITKQGAPREILSYV